MLSLRKVQATSLGTMKGFLLIGLWLGAMGVSAAAPDAPAKKIRVLVVDGFSNHDWRKTTALLQGILEPTGLFETVVSTCPPATDVAAFRAWRPAFAASDVVIQTCNDINHSGPAWPAAVQADFERFVREGGGVYIFHSAQNAFAYWPAYNQIIGLGWRPVSYGTALEIGGEGNIIRVPPGEGRGTGHAPNADVVVRLLGQHPIHDGMPRAWKTPHLEVYFDARGPAENVEVLSFARDPRFEQNWPIEWTVRYGAGRVYVATFGHVWRDGAGNTDPQAEAMRCVGVQTNIVRALQWLAQRPVTWPVPSDFPTENEKSLRPLPPVDAAARR